MGDIQCGIYTNQKNALVNPIIYGISVPGPPCLSMSLLYIYIYYTYYILYIHIHMYILLYIYNVYTYDIIAILQRDAESCFQTLPLSGSQKKIQVSAF